MHVNVRQLASSIIILQYSDILLTQNGPSSQSVGCLTYQLVKGNITVTVRVITPHPTTHEVTCPTARPHTPRDHISSCHTPIDKIPILLPDPTSPGGSPEPARGFHSLPDYLSCNTPWDYLVSYMTPHPWGIAWG